MELMDLYILEKAIGGGGGKKLNTSKLVQMPVSVRGKDGKIHTRMQWVDPNKGKGGKDKKISNEYEDGMGNLLNVEVSRETAKKLYEEFKDMEFQDVYDLLDSEREIETVDDQIDMEEETRAIMAIVEEYGRYKVDIGKTTETKEKDTPEPDLYIAPLVGDARIDAGIDTIVSEINEYIPEAVRMDGYKDALSFENVSTFEYEIEEVILRDIDNSTGSDHAKSMQKQAWKEGNTKHGFTQAFHPKAAKALVNALIGEENANKARGFMEKANLTINFNSDNTEGIRKKGYRASTDEDFAEKNLSEESFEKYIEMKYEGATMEDIYSEVPMSYNVFTELEDRANAEENAIGLKLTDDKPSYVAFNPFGKDEGGAPYFGDSHFTFKDESQILANSTLTMDDTFNRSESFAKVYDMDHLKDIYILKMIELGENINWDNQNADRWGIPYWSAESGGVPLELQVHQGAFAPSELSGFVIDGDAVNDDYVPLDITNDLDTDIDDWDDLIDSGDWDNIDNMDTNEDW